MATTTPPTAPSPSHNHEVSRSCLRLSSFTDRGIVHSTISDCADSHYDRSVADPGGTRAAEDVILELCLEVSHSGRQRKGREPLVVAESALHDVVGEVRQERSVGRPWASRHDPVGDLEKAARPDPAGDRLAARLVGAKAGEQAGEIDDARPIVRDEDTSRTHMGTRRAECLELVGRVERRIWQQTARRTTHEDGLEGAAGGRLPAEADDVAERRSHGNLGDTVPGVPADVDQDRARTRLRADRGVCLGTVDDDPRNGRECSSFQQG